MFDYSCEYSGFDTTVPIAYRSVIFTNARHHTINVSAVVFIQHTQYIDLKHHIASQAPMAPIIAISYGLLTLSRRPWPIRAMSGRIAAHNNTPSVNTAHKPKQIKTNICAMVMIIPPAHYWVTLVMHILPVLV